MYNCDRYYSVGIHQNKFTAVRGNIDAILRAGQGWWLIPETELPRVKASHLNHPSLSFITLKPVRVALLIKINLYENRSLILRLGLLPLQ